MPYPTDVLLPANAKYYGFIDRSKPFNIHWDISWSFTFALTGRPEQQHGICTFLTTNPFLQSAIPGQYLGFLGDYPYLYTESNQIILTEDIEPVLVDNISYSYDKSGFLAIAFDSTGFFGLSTATIPGVAFDNVKKNSLIVRDDSNALLFYQSLSSLSTKFFLSSSNKNYQTLRFRYTNNGRRLYIDFKTDNSEFETLTSLNVFNFNNQNINPQSPIYTGLTFCSPISSSNLEPSTLFLKNFNYNGLSAEPTYDVVPVEPIYSSNLTYTTISGISSL